MTDNPTPHAEAKKIIDEAIASCNDLPELELLYVLARIAAALDYIAAS